MENLEVRKIRSMAEMRKIKREMMKATIRTNPEPRNIGLTNAGLEQLNSDIAADLRQNEIARKMSELHSRDRFIS